MYERATVFYVSAFGGSPQQSMQRTTARKLEIASGSKRIGSLVSRAVRYERKQERSCSAVLHFADGIQPLPGGCGNLAAQYGIAAL